MPDLDLDRLRRIAAGIPRKYRRRAERWGRGEGWRLAAKVREGEMTREDVEALRAAYPNDGEPIVALQWLDKWGL